MTNLEVIGRIGRQGEGKNIGGRDAFVFSVASDTTRGGQKVTEWIEVIYFQTQSRLMQYLKKGAMVRVSGRMSVSAYINKESKPVPSVSVFASDIDIILFAKDEQTQQQVQQQQQQYGASTSGQYTQTPVNFGGEKRIYPNAQPTANQNYQKMANENPNIQEFVQAIGGQPVEMNDLPFNIRTHTEY